MRLDKYLVENGFFNTRAKAQEAIKLGQVYSDGKAITKPSEEKYGEITLSEDVLKYVSRAGLKLEKAIEHYHLDFNNKRVLDVGSSTGGFTEVSLLNGAKEVVSVDVGKDQMDKSLRDNPKIRLMEETNILDLTSDDIKDVDIIVMDVSFVSITKIIPHLMEFGAKEYVILIKPQFETGGEHLVKGVVKDRKVHDKVVRDITKFVKDLGLNFIGVTSSPIKGGSGNKEFIMYVKEKRVC